MLFLFPVSVENIEDVPEAFRAYYSVKDGETSATLVDDLKKKFEAGPNAIKALDTERKSKTLAEKAAIAWRAKAKEIFDVETPEALTEKWAEIEAAHTQALDEARVATGTKDENFEKRLNQALAEKEREAAKKLKVAEDATKKAEAERDAMYTSLELYMRENAATQALAAAKARGKILQPHVMHQTKIIKDDAGKYQLRVVDGDGDERVDGDGKPMSVESLVAQMRQSDEYSFAFDGDGATGSSSRTSTTSSKSSLKTNPWSKAHWNATDQAKLIKSNPALAKQMEAQAATENRAR